MKTTRQVTAGRRRPRRKSERQTEPWPPLEFCLPNLDTLEELSRGGPVVQKSLLLELPPDNSRETRIARLCSIPGVVLADTLPPHHGSCSAKKSLPRALGIVQVRDFGSL